MNRSILIVFAFFCIFDEIHAQDPVFSQFFINSPDQNPAVAGSANNPRLFLHYRNQWPTFANSFITYQGSIDGYLPKLKSGIGLNIVYDNTMQGALTTSNIDLMYSYRIKATKNLSLQAGLQASFQFNNTNLTNLVTSTAGATSSTAQPDFGIGLLGKTKSSQIGLAIHHLNTGYMRFNYNYIVQPLKISFFYSKDFNITNPDIIKENGFVLTPAVLIQKQSSSMMINYGIGITKYNFNAGLWVRTNLPLQFTNTILSLGMAFNNFNIGYSYDYNWLSLSNIMPVTGAHEITIIKVFPLDPKRGRYRSIKCPEIETNLQ